MQQLKKIVFALLLMVVCIGFTAPDDAHALKVYKKTSNLIGTPTKKNGIVVTTVSPTALSVKHAKYLVQGFNGKVVDAAVVTSKTRITGFAYNCPGYYTTRIYSDKKGRNMIGYIQVYVAQADIANHSKCAKVTPPKSSKPKPEPTPENKYPEPEPDPEPDPPAPKKIHPVPTVEVKIEQKPAPKPTPTPPKPEPPPPPPTPAPTKEELENNICKRASVYGGYDSGYEPNRDQAYYPSHYPSPVDPNGGKGMYLLTTLKNDGSKYNSSNDYYVLKANNDGDYKCCPIGAGLSNIMMPNGLYDCVKASAAQVQASYCALNPSGTVYNAATNQCEREEITYEGDPDGWPLELEKWEETEDDEPGFGERSYDAETYNNGNDEEIPVEEESSGGCELCKVFECPGFEEIVLPGLKDVGAELIGTVETPPVPDLPRPTMPNLFEILNDVEQRNPAKPTGEDGIKDAGFDADDVKEQAPDIPVREDQSGGFEIVDPVEALPDDYSDAPVPAGEEIPIPNGDYDANATPPGGYDANATPPGGYDANATPPSADETATPPDYESVAIPPSSE